MIPAETLAEFRLNVLNRILWAVVVLGGGAATVSVLNEIREEHLGIAAFYVVAFGVVVAAAAMKRTGYFVRTAIVLGAVYAVGISEFVLFGTASMGDMFFLAGIVFASLLLDSRAVVTIFAISFLAIAVIVWAYSSGRVPISYGEQEISLEPLDWLAPIFTYGFLSAMAVASITHLLGQLERSTASSHRLVKDLRNEMREKEEVADQLRQSQKLEAVGKLAGGIAHDFNNMITVINGYSGLLLDELGADSPLRPDIEQIGAAGDRAAQLTDKLLAFSRKQIIQPAVISLNDAVTQMEGLIRRVISENINIQVVLDPALWNVMADAAQMEQVILNLAVNARDAMPGGGKLTIETTNATLDEAYAASHVSVRSGPYAMLAVSDNGIGMDEETLKQIFEPFFTTKEVGKGTGLGLSMVYGAVKQSGGSVWAYSEPGKGTTIKLYLPRVEAELDAEHDRTTIPSELATGSETILHVEDDDAVRDLTSRILEKGSYNVFQAGSGEEALTIVNGMTGPIDLLITDVVLPGMTGRELAKKLEATIPGIKVLFVSGYAENSIVHQGTLDEGVNFLCKPYTSTSLLDKIRAVLDSASRPPD